MAATDLAITLTAFLKFEAPDGDVRLCCGGVVQFEGDWYQAQDPVFGSIHKVERIRAAFGDQAEKGRVTLNPDPEADVADWWRADLRDCRLRIWLAEVDSDGFTATGEELLADWLVDEITRVQSAAGDQLQMDMMSRTERLFLTDEGNVCSDRFHQSVWPGETGFVNCTDIQGYFAWGTLETGREEPIKGGKKKKKGKG